MPVAPWTLWSRPAFGRVGCLICVAILIWTDGAGAMPLEYGVKAMAAQTVELRCRLGDGPWQHCRMHVQEIGMSWWIEIGNYKSHFRHDGRGAIAMERPGGRWSPVKTRWLTDTPTTEPALCWDELCALGSIPLD